MMLDHVQEHQAARRIETALIEHFREGGIRTPDLGGSASTNEFTEALCQRIGKLKSA
jgi:isocitrate dehydrogenase (NAD+)